jgi:hypothetical protein
MRYLILALSLIFVAPAAAQADRASLTGTITDVTQANIPNAAVKVIYPATGLSRETISSGVFRLSGLPIGACYVEVRAAGFRSIKNGFHRSVRRGNARAGRGTRSRSRGIGCGGGGRDRSAQSK